MANDDNVSTGRWTTGEGGGGGGNNVIPPSPPLSSLASSWGMGFNNRHCCPSRSFVLTTASEKEQPVILPPHPPWSNAGQGHKRAMLPTMMTGGEEATAHEKIAMGRGTMGEG